MTGPERVLVRRSADLARQLGAMAQLMVEALFADPETAEIAPAVEGLRTISVQIENRLYEAAGDGD